MLFLFKTLVSWRAFIVKATILTTIVVVIVSLLLPKWYTARTTVFPPEVGGGMGMYSDILQNFSVPILGGAMTSGISPESINIEMLRSYRVGTRVIEEFDLIKRYKVSVVEQALKKLHSRMGFTLLENGLLVVTFEDRDPQRAAEILNRMVVMLDELHADLNVARAARTRVFIGDQLDGRQAALAAAEAELNRFQEEHHVLAIDEQLRTALEIVATLTADAIALETEMEILSTYSSKTSEEYLSKMREYNAVVAQLKRLKVDDAEDDADMVRSFVPSLDDVPDLALEFLRLKRQVEIETAVYTMLIKEHEKSRIEEARDTSTLQVLDQATPPNLRSRPRRKQLVMVGFAFGLLWSSMLALMVSAWRENRESSEIARHVIDPVVGDFSRLFRRK